jgi:hypothetical protein
MTGDHRDSEKTRQGVQLRRLVSASHGKAAAELAGLGLGRSSAGDILESVHYSHRVRALINWDFAVRQYGAIRRPCATITFIVRIPIFQWNLMPYQTDVGVSRIEKFCHLTQPQEQH